MATTTKEKGSGSAGDGMEKKMKKATSSNPQPPKKTPTKPSASQHTLSSSSDQKPEKPLPNYLKPTISSSLDFSSSRTSRRSTTDPKPATTTRRHPVVEKPPVQAHTHKAPSTKTAPLRSFSSLASHKTTKAGAGPAVMRRSLSAKGATSSKGVAKSGSKDVVPPESSAELEPQSNNNKDLVETPSDSVVLETPSQEEPLVDSDVAMKEEEVHDEAVVDKAEEGEQQQEQEVQEQDQAPHEEHVELPVAIEEEKTIDMKDEEEEMKLEDHADEEKGTEEIDEKDVAVEVEQESGEGSKEVQKDNKNEGPARQAQSGKEAQAYNDVIEETASKLMEDNSANKVRALAGAFETVISLQDTTK